jgi:hypothetical protein
MEKNIYLDGQYFAKNPLYHVEDSLWKARQVLKMLDKHNLQIFSVCEVGCGAGEILRQLQIRMPETTTFCGYEISPQAFDLSKQRETERLSFYYGDFFAKDTEVFDLLLCLDVFEHIDDYMGFLRKLRKKAKYKIFHIPIDISVQSVLRCSPIMHNRKMVGHLHYFTKETALATLRDTGHGIEDYFYTPGSIDIDKSLKAKLMKLPRRLFSLISLDFTVRILGGYSLLVLAR